MVYFVIVTYNSSEFIRKCIESIITFEPETEIVVVDNKSNDNSIEIVKSFPNVFLFENEINMGFGSANNIGINYALMNDADYIFLINHDAYLVEPIIEKAMNVFTQFPDYGILTPFQVKKDRVSLEVNFSRFLSFDGILGEITNDIFLRDVKRKIYEIPFAQAAAWMIKKETIKKVGYFNPLFFHYGEDNEYLCRLKYHNLKLGLITNSRIVHLANPLNLNHKKNYDKYHRNRIFNKWLINLLDINKKFDLNIWIKSLLPYLKSLVFTFLKLQFLKACRQFLLIIRMIKISHKINKARRINESIYCEN
jgi:GT2 family glycosyltransferase